MTESALPREADGDRAMSSRPRGQAVREAWHHWKALSAAITGALGVVLLVNSHGSAVSIFFGILFLLAVIAGSVVTRFWSRFDHLEWWAKGVARAAYMPGGAFGIVVLWMMKTINGIARIMR